MDYRYRSPLEDSYQEQESVGLRKTGYGPRPSPYGSRSQYDGRSSYGGSSQSGSSKHSYGEWIPVNTVARHSEEEHPGAYSVRSQSYSDRYKPTSYPRELTDLFGALECRLCGLELQTPLVAKMHYSGKPHMKKIKSFLTEWCDKTGCPMPDLGDNAQNRPLTSNMADYCDVCDVRLISVNDKVLHYSGRNHQKNARDPGNAKKKKKTYDIIDVSTSRFGIGIGFQPQTPETHKATMSTQYISKDDLHCLLCDVKAVSMEQLKMHLSGRKHKDKVAKTESTVPKAEKLYTCKICDVSLPTNVQWNLHLKGKRHMKNMSKLEMEGSSDYCKLCDVTFTSYEQYLSHIQGKKHEKQSQKTNWPAKKDDKISLTCKFCPFVGNIDEHYCDESLMKIEYDDLENKLVCFPCHNMVFNSEEEFNDHQNSRRHLLCVVNQEDGDKIIAELEHWYCYTCKKQLRNHKEYTEHLFESKHLTLTTNLDSTTDLFQCTVCNVLMDKQAKEEHMRDRKHLRQVVKNDTQTTVSKMANDDISATNFHCSNCNVTSNNFIKYSEHLFSEAHMEQMIAEILQKN